MLRLIILSLYVLLVAVKNRTRRWQQYKSVGGICASVGTAVSIFVEKLHLCSVGIQ
jgi:hypothetical protein